MFIVPRGSVSHKDTRTSQLQRITVIVSSFCDTVRQYGGRIYSESWTREFQGTSFEFHHRVADRTRYPNNKDGLAHNMSYFLFVKNQQGQLLFMLVLEEREDVSYVSQMPCIAARIITFGPGGDLSRPPETDIKPPQQFGDDCMLSSRQGRNLKTFSRFCEVRGLGSGDKMQFALIRLKVSSGGSESDQWVLTPTTHLATPLLHDLHDDRLDTPLPAGLPSYPTINLLPDQPSPLLLDRRLDDPPTPPHQISPSVQQGFLYPQASPMLQPLYYGPQNNPDANPPPYRRN